LAEDRELENYLQRLIHEIEEADEEEEMKENLDK